MQLPRADHAKMDRYYHGHSKRHYYRDSVLCWSCNIWCKGYKIGQQIRVGTYMGSQRNIFFRISKYDYIYIFFFLQRIIAPASGHCTWRLIFCFNSVVFLTIKEQLRICHSSQINSLCLITNRSAQCCHFPSFWLHKLRSTWTRHTESSTTRTMCHRREITITRASLPPIGRAKECTKSVTLSTSIGQTCLTWSKYQLCFLKTTFTLRFCWVLLWVHKKIVSEISNLVLALIL